VLEAVTGRCDGCEDYIQESRITDLRKQAADAGQKEAEARRREARLDATPPGLIQCSVNHMR
jgi:hypothetical protein